MSFNMKIGLIFLFSISLLLLDFGSGTAANSPKTSAVKNLDIIRITPSGNDVPASKQIVIEFNRPVVPLGRMDRRPEELGITISPSLRCQWRWINTSSLSCNLADEDSMIQSTTYNLTIEPKIMAQDGGKIEKIQNHQFTTQRPSITGYDFISWRTASTPVIKVSFNQPVLKSSVEQHLYIKAHDSKERYGLAVNPDESAKTKTLPAQNIWIVEPIKPLPLETMASLTSEPGLASSTGPALSADNKNVATFQTFPDFKFMGVSCYDNQDSFILIKYKAPEDSRLLCNPMRPIALAFSAPVPRSKVKKHVEFIPRPINSSQNSDLWGNESSEETYFIYNRTESDLYYVQIPLSFKSASTYTLKLPKDTYSLGHSADKTTEDKSLLIPFTDVFGRSLSSPVSMTFSTNHRNPNFEMPYQSGVLEKNINTDIPFYVNNLDGYQFNYRLLTSDSVKENKIFRQKTENIKDVQYAVPFGVRKILGERSGVVFGTLDTTPKIPAKSEYQKRLFAQITPFQAHLKLGHFNSLAWVTDLSTGLPVEGAKVSLFKDSYKTLNAPKNIVSTATTDKNGIAQFPGVKEISPDQDLLEGDTDTKKQLFFLRVEKANDIAILPIDNSFILNTWELTDSDVFSSNLPRYGHIISWGMTAQGIYRRGDTIEYKIFIRDQTNTTLSPVPEKGKYILTISDPMGKVVDEVKNIKFSNFGAYHGKYKIPESSAVGWYSFLLSGNYSGGEPFNQNNLNDPKGKGFITFPLHVVVADFTPAPFKVLTELNGKEFYRTDSVSIESRAMLHSGGPYVDASGQITLTLYERQFSPETNIAKGFIFGSSSNETYQLFQKTGKLDAKGEWSASFPIPEQPVYYGRLQAESSVQDDRGKSVASFANATFFGVDRFVGLKSDKWFYESKKPISLKTIVVDKNGNAIKGIPINVNIDVESVSVAKVKTSGNAYTSDITREWKSVGGCTSQSLDQEGNCIFTPTSAGSYRAVATVQDTKGREQKTEILLWVSGSDYVQWADDEKLSIPVMAEKKSYQIGETAKFMVKNPYPGATALITVERYGILDQFVQKLDGSTSIVEIPIKPDYMPGFYLSVLVVSPRVDSPPPELGQVDMGKPAFRMGYLRVPVIDPYKEIIVDIKPARDVYQPRDQVQVDLTAIPRNQTEKKEPIELAIAVVDESVFDLISKGKDAFDPYKGFYTLNSLDVRNYSLLYRLLGRQKFELKGANPGGDGGADVDVRNLFKYVSYWNPSVLTDKNGHAKIDFEAPDNLTGWRILAIATTPTDRMGLGDGGFKVNRETEIRPVMPNQVHEGDQFSAGFSVMNRTDKERKLNVSIEAVGNIESPKHAPITKTETISLSPYKRTILYLPLKAGLLPIDQEFKKGKIDFVVTAGDGIDQDRMEFSLSTLKNRLVDVSANSITTTQSLIKEPISFPKDIYTDTGDLSVTVSPSVIGNVAGAFEYMRNYPYLCWEQVLTKGVMAAHYKDLRLWIPESIKWPESETLPQEALDKAVNYQAPNGGMTYFLPKDAHADPYLSAYTALAFEWLKKDGYKIPENVTKNLHTYLLNFLKQDSAPDFYQSGMKSTVRAVALSALAKSGKITETDIARYRPYLKDMSLFGKANFLDAALSLKTTSAAADEAFKMILAASNETSGQLMFNETLDDGYTRLLVTPLRDNCAILSSLMAYQLKSRKRNLLGDKPFKIVRAITNSRGNRDHWENTHENLFCMNGLIDYARVYETQKPIMTVTAKMDGKSFGETSFKNFKDTPKTFSKPIEKSDEGKNTTIQIDKKGDGRLYATTRLSYAMKEPLEKVNAGMDLHREYSIQKDSRWSLIQKNQILKRGDLVRVDLYLSLPSARNFVVVNDPLPGALETVNRDLATASTVDSSKAEYDSAGGAFWYKFDDWVEFGASFWGFYHKELRSDSAQFFSDWLPAGNYHLSYMTQVIADGEFIAPGTHAEEMYNPDVYARARHESLIVKTE